MTSSKISNASILVSAKISGITETQIEDTVAPLGRVIDVVEWMISIGTYSEVTLNVASRRRLDVVGFLIHYIVQLLQEDEAEELTNLIRSGGITDQFAQELATEFNISAVNITVESIIAIQMTGVAAESKTLGLLGWIFGLFFFILCILLVAIMFKIASHYKKLLKSQSPEKNTEDKKEPGDNKEQPRELHKAGARGVYIQTGIHEDSDEKIDNKAGSDNIPIPETPPCARGTTIDLTSLEQSSKLSGFGVEDSFTKANGAGAAGETVRSDTEKSNAKRHRRRVPQKSHSRKTSLGSNHSWKTSDSRDSQRPEMDSRGIQL